MKKLLSIKKKLINITRDCLSKDFIFFIFIKEEFNYLTAYYNIIKQDMIYDFT